MEWTEDYESGIPDIDAQHRQIFLLIQRVGESGARRDRGDIRELVVQLEKATCHHFEYEERLMTECDYPDAAHHAAEHAQLLAELKGYEDNKVFNAGQLTLVLSNWLMAHTLMEDRPLARYLLQFRTQGSDWCAHDRGPTPPNLVKG